MCFSVAGMLGVDFDDPLMPVKYGLTNPKVLFMEAVGLCWHAHCQHPASPTLPLPKMERTKDRRGP